LIRADQPALVLAPMEGVTDSPMRALLTERGGFGLCVTEFLRVTDQAPPAHVFLLHVPELAHGGRTPAGTPVQVQLLGGNEEKMAESARRACELGAPGIDINFGCPSPIVNRNDGGAALLRHPERIRQIVAAVRAAVPREIPVSAKLRLGWENTSDIFVNAEQAVLGGASWLTLHARTRVQGYRPPAHWRVVGEVRKRVGIPVVANGEIWTIDDFDRCREETGCSHFMLARGALGDPALVHEIARRLGILSADVAAEAYPFGDAPERWSPLMRRFSELAEPRSRGGQYTARRIKQWATFAHMRKPLPWFDRLKRGQSLDEVLAALA
jgi:tRNA-dihydrouridine synthase C